MHGIIFIMKMFVSKHTGMEGFQAKKQYFEREGRQMQRIDGRNNEQIRPVKITRNYLKHAEGSVLIEMGDTKVICTASVDDKVPPL